MALYRPRLVMIGHGTTGADGIQSGNHLRWGFDRVMGFPLGGFRLYRRLSSKHRAESYCLGFDEYLRHRFEEPFSLSPSTSREEVTFSASRWPILVVPRGFGSGPSDAFLEFRGTLEVVFPRPVRLAQVTGYWQEGDNLTVQALAGEQVVDVGRLGPPPGNLGTVTFSGPYFDSLRIIAGLGGVSEICYTPLERDSDSGWELISGQLPISLPYTHVNYPLKHKHYGQPDGDWLAAQDRISGGTYTRPAFDKMLSLFSQMFEDDPEGSMLIKAWSYTPTVTDGPELRAVPTDLLLITSVDPTVARILGLYFVDSQARVGVPYDYKIVGNWPTGSTWLLDQFVVTFESLFEGKRFPTYFSHAGLCFSAVSPEIVQRDSQLAGTERALHPNVAGRTTLRVYFPKPVGEVQLFVSGASSSTKLTGYVGTMPVATANARGRPQEILAVGAEGMDHVELEGQDLYLHKVCFDTEYIGYGDHSFVVYGIVRQPAHRPAPPSGLTATPFTGATKKLSDGTIRDARLCVGLVWDLADESTWSLLRRSLIRYRLKRISPDGASVDITHGVPMLVSPLKDRGAVQQPDYWPEDRQYIVDAVPQPGDYSYQVAGIDIFGRQSNFSLPVSTTVAETLYPPPPAPINVRARYIDPSDPWLSAGDRAWVDEHGGQWGLAVSWKWPQRLEEQHPGVKEFFIHLQSGWLNMLRGTITAVTDNGDATSSVEVLSEELSSVSSGDLKDCKLQSSRRFYTISDNTAGAASGDGLLLTVTIANPTSGTSLPVTGPCTIALVSSSPLYENYREANRWEHYRLDSAAKSTVGDYSVVVEAPPLSPSQADPKVYAQVGVTAYDGRQESPVSAPATVVAVYRQAPAAPGWTESENVYATFPDVYGKASYTFQWPKDESVPYYEVYRCVEEALFQVDPSARANGRSQDRSDYEEFLSNYSEPLASAIYEQLISADEVDYESLDNDLLQALASLPGNEGAFFKVHEGTLAAEEYLDPEDVTLLAYTDKTLPGKGANRYFYRARAVDAVGNRSELGLASLPVYLRDVNPPRPPGIVKVLGGDRQITLIWSVNRESSLSQYRVYRTDSETDATDIRLMELVHACSADECVAPAAVYGGLLTLGPETDVQEVIGVYKADGYDESLGPESQTAENYFTAESTHKGRLISGVDLESGAQVVVIYRGSDGVANVATAVQDQRAYTDTDVKAGTAYYYRLVAVRGLSYDDGLTAEVPSQATAVQAARCYDDSRPAPPQWLPTSTSEQGLVLTWTSEDPNLTCLVQRREPEEEWEAISNWLPRGEYTFVDDGRENEVTYSYRLKVVDERGRANSTYIELEV